MKLERTVNVYRDNHSFSVNYISWEHDKSDEQIKIYDTYKISILITDGLTAVINNKILKNMGGDILFFRPNELHYGRFLRKGTHEYIDFHIPVDFFDRFADKSKFAFIFEDTDEKRINYIRPSVDDAGRILQNAERIKKLSEKDDYMSAVELYKILLDTILFCAEEYPRQKEAYVTERIPPCVTGCVEYVSKNYADSILLSDIARQSGCSVTYLSRKFKEHLGITVYDYIMKYRITMAQKSLRSGKNVTETCYSCGFSDCSGFIQAFKKIVGTTPHKYKADAERLE